MTYGEIKIEALKLMFVNYSFDMSVEDIEKMKTDESYGSYLVNMDGAINRALDRIENACVVPVKKYAIVDDNLTREGDLKVFDLNKISDLFQVERISSINSYGDYCGDVEFNIDAEELLIRQNYSNFKVIYYPQLPRKTNKLSDFDELDIPDNIARLIPYYIKSELYQEEEPTISADARNIFEACLEDLKKPTISKQNYVEQVIRFC